MLPPPELCWILGLTDLNKYVGEIVFRCSICKRVVDLNEKKHYLDGMLICSYCWCDPFEK